MSTVIVSTMQRATENRTRRGLLAGIVATFLIVTLNSCSTDGRELRLPRPDQDESIITTTAAPEDAVSFDASSLPAFETDLLEISVPWSNDGEIPIQFTCRGDNVSPDVAWFDVVPGAVAMAIIFYQEQPERTTHWIVANLDPQTAYIEADSVPLDALVGANDPVLGISTSGYRGPCPEPGQTRFYTLEVHALSQYLDLPPETPAEDLTTAIDLASIQMSSITGTFTG